MFRRLYLPVLVVIVALAASLGWFGAARLRAAQLEEFEGALRQEARLVRALIAEDLREGRSAEAMRRLRRIEPDSGRRVTLIAADGKVLADTDADPAAMTITASVRKSRRRWPRVKASASGGAIPSGGS